MSTHRIFTFWEPKDSLPAYLRLCRETWRRNSPGFELVELDYANFEHYAGAGVLDREILRTLRLYSQKDAILFAVLARNGGIFMDMDTIVNSDLSSLENLLHRTELLMFHVHVGVVAARPGAEVVLACLEGVRHKLAWLREGRIRREDVRSDFLGNSILHKVVWDAARRHDILARVQGAVLGAVAGVLDHTGNGGRKASVFVTRADEYLATQLIFRYRHRDKFLMLSRDRHGFIAERVHGDRRIRDPRQQYLDYWFGTGDAARHVAPPRAAVIGLHNSWTPAWYAALSESEVLGHECLLSRTLRSSLGLPDPG